ncbi:MAG TPA: DNA polymerase III subunit alpha [bacterium]|nr:DNA polymerase III subunit alpha [bacterium]
MSRPEFVHLHLHSQYSLLESTVRLDPLMARLKELGMPAAALTDKANLFGAVHFYQSALSHGIKPILGCEMLVAPRSRFDKTHAHGRPEAAYHLVLLAENEEGYHNLMKLSSAGYLQGYFLGPRIDKELLARHSKGLIALSGCLDGEIADLLLKDEMPPALKAVGEYQDIFGKDRFFLEIQDHGLEKEKKVGRALAELSQKTGAPLVATNDVHYLRREEAEYQEVLLCLGKGETLSSPAHPSYGSDQFYLKSPDEMAALFAEMPEALRRTLEISERCHLTMEFEKLQMPKFPVPPGAGSEDAYLVELCRLGLDRRFGKGAEAPAVQDRLKEELDVIRRTGFSGYFLIVADFIQAARKAGIPVGPGRGSAAGSLVSYLLEITDLDPLKYDLLFERFINPERVSAPDIDVDVCDRRRGEVLDYITRKYGADKVASIITFGTLAARAVLRDVGRVLEIPPAQIDRIAKLVPYELKITLEDCAAKVPELKAIATEPGPLRKWWDVSRALEGLFRHASTHAAGIIIGNDSLMEAIPLYRGGEGETMSQFDMNALKEVGLLKIDVLGLRTLTVIDDALELIRQTRGRRPDLSKIPEADGPTFELLQQARTGGIFQLESRGMRDYMRKLKPETLEDLTALNALYRPGPLGSDMVDDFIRRRRGQVQVKYLHPRLEPILKSTYGVILYQEQVMRVAKDLAGFSLGQADLLRRSMGSKNPEQMEKMRGRFLEGAKAEKIPAETAESIFNLMAKFAGYGYNKSHSAAYALVAYQTAYLKANYAPEFMAALLTSESGNQDKVAQYVYECRRMGLKVLPPDVNESADRFTVDASGRIRFSLLAIKNVGGPSVAAILEARKAGPFTSLFDFCRRVDLRSMTPKLVESLILAGAFDSTGAARAPMKEAAEKAFRQGQAVREDSQRGQTSLFGALETAAPDALPDVAEYSPAQRLMAEKETLGFYLSGHPLSEHEWALEHYVTPLSEVGDLPDGTEVRVGGMILGFSKSQVKKTQELYGRFILEDLHSHIDVIAWPEVFKKYQDHLGKEKLVAVKGRLDKSGDRIQLIANEILDVRDMGGKWAKGIRVNLNMVGLEGGLLNRLKEICEKFPGQVPVYFHLQTSHRGLMVMEAGEELKVNPSQAFLKAMNDLVGDDSTEIEV